MIKVAHPNDLPVAERIMRQIHDENPSYWPYGLDTAQFNGGLYLMQKTASSEPVGFVGWQALPEEGKTIGYYAVGVLPEHRRKGFAKQAVAQVIREIGNHCDEVRALIMEHNEPSKAMARSLRVPILEKLAGVDKAAKAGPRGQAITALLTGIGSAGFFDQTADPDRTIESTLRPWEWDKERSLMGVLNALLGGVGGQRLAVNQVGQGLGSIALAPTKDLAIKGVGSLYRIDEAAEEAAKTFAVERDQMENPVEEAPATTWTEHVPKGVWAGAGALGLGALGLLAVNARRKHKLKERELAQAEEGKVHVTLPTKRPGDVETYIELPVGDLNLSKSLRGRLGRDTRRRLLDETKARTRTRKKKPAEDEKEKEKSATITSRIAGLVDELDTHKSANFGQIGPNQAPAASVPTPPQVGQNPAMRMQQQETAAKSIQPSTDANPQIMQAQQAAAQAEQQGAAQVAQAQQESAAQLAQAQQAAQEAQMQQQQQFSEQLAKAEHEKEILTLQLEKEKAMGELKDAQNKSQSDIASATGKGEGDAVQRMANSRIGRLKTKVSKGKSKAASAPGVIPAAGKVGDLDPNTGVPIQPPAKHLRPHAANNYNRSAGSSQSPRIGIYRTSFGPIMDTAYDFIRNKIWTPDPPKHLGRMSRADMINSPDKMGVISNLYSAGSDLYHRHNAGDRSLLGGLLTAVSGAGAGPARYM